MDGDADVAAVAAAIGHPARGTMLVAPPRPVRSLREGDPAPLSALGAAVLHTLLDQRWLSRRLGSRALVVTPAGQHGLHAELGLEVA